jgi:hypothetical protein
MSAEKKKEYLLKQRIARQQKRLQLCIFQTKVSKYMNRYLIIGMTLIQVGQSCSGTHDTDKNQPRRDHDQAH